MAKQPKPASKFPPEIQAMIDDGLITTGDDPDLILTFVPTGIVPLDDMLGGGFVRGCTTLMYGEFSTGKTYLTLKAIAAAQAAGELCAFIDAEQTYNAVWAEQVGVDTEKLLVSQPKTGEKVIDVAVSLLKTGQVALLAIDSLAAMVPTSEVDQDTDKGFGAIQAKLITKGMRRILGNNDNTAVICLNHVRTNLSVPGDSIPGGRAQRQYTISVLKVARHEWISEKKNGKTKRVGFKMRVELKKTKTSPPEQFIIMPFYYDSAGIDVLAAEIDYAIELGIVKRAGSTYKWDDEVFVGKQKLYDYVDEDDEAYKRLAQQIKVERAK